MKACGNQSDSERNITVCSYPYHWQRKWDEHFLWIERAHTGCSHFFHIAHSTYTTATKSPSQILKDVFFWLFGQANCEYLQRLFGRLVVIWDDESWKMRCECVKMFVVDVYFAFCQQWFSGTCLAIDIELIRIRNFVFGIWIPSKHSLNAVVFLFYSGCFTYFSFQANQSLSFAEVIRCVQRLKITRTQ